MEYDGVTVRKKSLTEPLKTSCDVLREVAAATPANNYFDYRSPVNQTLAKRRLLFWLALST